MRVDGAASWSDVRSLLTFNATSGLLELAGFVSGDHTIEIRGTDVTAGPDKTPWTTVWHVDTSPPVVTFLHTPVAFNSVPTTTAQFVIATDRPQWTVLLYQLYQQVYNASAGQLQWQCVSCSGGSIWSVQPQGAMALSNLSPGVLYRLDVRGNNTFGALGMVSSWQWSSAACLSAGDATISNLQAVSVGYGQRVITWSPLDPDTPRRVAYYQIRVDNGSWANVTDAFLALSAVALNAVHNVSVRSVVLPQCVAVAGALMYPTTSMSWYEYGYAPGTPSFVSTPPLQSTSAYADFTFFSTALPETSSFQYSLDASTWSVNVVDDRRQL